MYTPSPSMVKRIVAYDLANIETHARYVFVIDEHGVPISYQKKEPYGLNVIAVLGKGIIQGIPFEKLILLEVGIKRTKPYREAKSPQGYSDKMRHFESRRKMHSLTQEQFKNFASFLYDILHAEAVRVIDGWEKNEPRMIFAGNKWRPFEVGVCFSCAFNDHPLLTAVILADRKHRHQSLVQKAGLINYELRHLKYSDYSDSALKRLLSVGKVVEILRKHPISPYHFSFFKSKIKKIVLFQNIVEAFNLIDLEKVISFDRILKDNGIKVLFNRASIHIKREREQKGYLVFEFIPHKK